MNICKLDIGYEAALRPNNNCYIAMYNNSNLSNNAVSNSNAYVVVVMKTVHVYHAMHSL